MAELVTYSAVMGAGKSDLLIKQRFGIVNSGHKALALKPSQDTKADTKIISRTGLDIESDFTIPPEMTGNELREKIYEIHSQTRRGQQLGNEMARRVIGLRWIYVDEAQFLSSSQVDGLYLTALRDDIPVTCYGLKADFRTETFPGMQRLYEVSDRVETIRDMAICRCGEEAKFNARQQNGVYIFEGGQVAIDGEDTVTYESLCGNCYLDEGGTVVFHAN